MTRRPFAVLDLCKNPCLFLRFLTDGWNVRLIAKSSSTTVEKEGQIIVCCWREEKVGQTIRLVFRSLICWLISEIMFETQLLLSMIELFLLLLFVGKIKDFCSVELEIKEENKRDDCWFFELLIIVEFHSICCCFGFVVEICLIWFVFDVVDETKRLTFRELNCWNDDLVFKNKLFNIIERFCWNSYSFFLWFKKLNFILEAKELKGKWYVILVFLFLATEMMNLVGLMCGKKRKFEFWFNLFWRTKIEKKWKTTIIIKFACFIYFQMCYWFVFARHFFKYYFLLNISGHLSQSKRIFQKKDNIILFINCLFT